MIDLTQNGIPHDEVLWFLKTQKGISAMNYRLDIISNGSSVRELPYTSCELSCYSEEQVKYTGNIECDYKIVQETDWPSHRIRPVIFFTYRGMPFEYNFVPLWPESRSITVRENSGAAILKAYDEMAALKDNSVGEILFFPKGTTYTTAISELLRKVGYTQTNIFPSNKVMQTNREDWTYDTGYLEVINELLSEIGYNQITVDQHGTPYASEYQEPSPDLAKITYESGELSVIYPQKTISHDSYNRPNQFVAVVSNPELEDVVWRAVAVNTNPSDETSTSKTYLKTRTETLSNIADLETLQDYANRKLREYSADYEYVTITTGNLPHHQVNDVININSNGVNGIWEETEWSMNFRKGGSTKRGLRRIVY